MRTIILLLAVLAVSGCGSPTKQWAASRETLTVTTQTLTFMARQEMLTDAQVVEIDKAVKTARAGLEEAEKQLPDGGATFSDMLDVVQAMLTKLATMEAQAKAKARKPSALNYKELPSGPAYNYRRDKCRTPFDRGCGSLCADPKREWRAYARAA